MRHWAGEASFASFDFARDTALLRSFYETVPDSADRAVRFLSAAAGRVSKGRTAIYALWHWPYAHPRAALRYGLRFAPATQEPLSSEFRDKTTNGCFLLKSPATPVSLLAMTRSTHVTP